MGAYSAAEDRCSNPRCGHRFRYESAYPDDAEGNAFREEAFSYPGRKDDPVVLAFFSDGSCQWDPQRAYFVFYSNPQDENRGPYVFPTIRGAVEQAREHLAKGDQVWLEMQRIPIDQGGEQIKIWDSRKPPKRRWG